MNSLPSYMTLVYVVKSFKSKRHTVSDTDSYFAYPHHAIWGLTENVDTIMRVEMIKVLIGSKEYLSAHHNSKLADEEEKARVLAPVVEKAPEPIEAKVGDTIYTGRRFFRVMKFPTPKMVTIKPLDEIVSRIKDESSKGDSQNEFGIETLTAGEPLPEDTQYGQTMTVARRRVNLIKRDTITQKYDTYSCH
jgi:hypothetical protein